MSNEVAPASQQAFSLVPKTLEEAVKFAEIIAKSAFAPRDYHGSPGNVLVAIQMGLELGVAPLQALQGIAVINGRPCVWGDLALAIVRNSCLLVDFEERDAAEALKQGGGRCRAVRKGQATEIVRTFSVEDAKRAGLWGKSGPWSTYPGRMLMMRARGWVIRDGFADCLRGLQIREEVVDIPTTDYTVSVAVPETKAPPLPTPRPSIAPAPPVPQDAHDVQYVEEEPEGVPEPIRHRESGDEPDIPFEEPPADSGDHGDGPPAPLKAVLDDIAKAANLKVLMPIGVRIGKLEVSLRDHATKAFNAKMAEIKGK